MKNLNGEYFLALQVREMQYLIAATLSDQWLKHGDHELCKSVATLLYERNIVPIDANC